MTKTSMIQTANKSTTTFVSAKVRYWLSTQYHTIQNHAMANLVSYLVRLTTQ